MGKSLKANQEDQILFRWCILTLFGVGRNLFLRILYILILNILEYACVIPLREYRQGSMPRSILLLGEDSNYFCYYISLISVHLILCGVLKFP